MFSIFIQVTYIDFFFLSNEEENVAIFKDSYVKV